MRKFLRYILLLSSCKASKVQAGQLAVLGYIGQSSNKLFETFISFFLFNYMAYGTLVLRAGPEE